MRNRDIQKCLGHGRFRLHNISVSVVAFRYLSMGFGFRSATYLVHLPKDVFDELLLVSIY